MKLGPKKVFHFMRGRLCVTLSLEFSQWFLPLLKEEKKEKRKTKILHYDLRLATYHHHLPRLHTTIDYLISLCLSIQSSLHPLRLYTFERKSRITKYSSNVMHMAL